MICVLQIRGPCGRVEVRPFFTSAALRRRHGSGGSQDWEMKLMDDRGLEPKNEG